MKKLLAPFLVCLLAGCSSSSSGVVGEGESGEFPGAERRPPSSGGSAGAAPSPGGVPRPGGNEAVGAGGYGVTLPAGVLAAGTWDDNLNFGLYADHLARVGAGRREGLLDIPRADRLVVTLKDGDGKPAAGAHVAIEASGARVFETTAGGEGTVLFFPEWYGARGPLTVRATLGGDEKTETVSAGTREALLVFTGETAPAVAALDVAFVLDGTASMGPELAYLRAQLPRLALDLRRAHPDLEVRWALMVYRDAGDDPVVQATPFTSDVAVVGKALDAQTAAGGGDYPEAVDEALHQTLDLAWRAKGAARVAFWIADAPHHADRTPEVGRALLRAREKGVHVYPVASRNADALTAHTMRSAAQLTGGRHLFLLDDAGPVGTADAVDFPCFHATPLVSALARMLSIEVSGDHLRPAAPDVLWEVGSPVQGTCHLGLDGEAHAF